MARYFNNAIRIKRSADQEEDMRRLTKAGIFESYRDILMISAILGFNNNLCTPITKAASDPVQITFFNARDYDIIDFIAYAHEKKQTVLNTDEKYEIFAQYANGGFPLLLKSLGLPEEDPIDEGTARTIILKYYTLLLSNSFVSDFDEEELAKNLLG